MSKVVKIINDLPALVLDNPATDVEAKEQIEGTQIQALYKLERYERINDDPIRLNNALVALRDLVWGYDIASPTCPEYREHHEQIQDILQFIDTKVLRGEK